MQFDKSTHKVIVSTLSKLEAGYYIDFLKEENDRHQKEINKLAGYISMLTIHPLIQFYESAILRHKEDIKETDEVIRKVRGMYEIADRH